MLSSSTVFIQSKPIEYQFYINIFNPSDSILGTEITPDNLGNDGLGEIFLTQPVGEDSIIEIYFTKRNSFEGSSIEKELIEFGLKLGFAAECFWLGYVLTQSINKNDKFLQLVSAGIASVIIPPVFILLTEDQDEFARLKKLILIFELKKSFELRINGSKTLNSFYVKRDKIILDLRKYRYNFKEEKNEIILLNKHVQIRITDKL